MDDLRDQSSKQHPIRIPLHENRAGLHSASHNAANGNIAATIRVRKDLELKGLLQYESWLVPVLNGHRQRDFTARTSASSDRRTRRKLTGFLTG